MRYIYIIIIWGISYGVSSQTPRYINLGQTPVPKEHACLVIRQQAKVLQKIREHIETYKEVTALKLIGFDEGDNKTDSVLALVKPLKSLKTLTFEDCDLSVLETSLAGFMELESVSLLNTVFFENTFFPLLKANAVKALSIQASDPELMTDSLYVLSALTSININSGNVFTKPNYTQTFQIKTAGSTRNIDMAYFGDHYKANATGVITVKKTASPKKPIAPGVTYPCIRQPIPGIDINDTTFIFDASKKGSFTYESGTTVSIDRQAFLTENGQKYEGEVTVFYREFRNPVEIMLSGIPMTNKVAGETQVFKSGGMYEINAFGQNDEPLTAASDTAIKINFALTDTSESFQFFSLNPNGSWTTTDQRITATSQNQATQNQSGKKSKPTKAVEEYFRLVNSNGRALPDTLRYEARFLNASYLYTSRKDNLIPFDAKDTTLYVREFDYAKNKTVKAKGLFRIKYYKQTKDKQIVFKFVPYKTYVDMPSYVMELTTKEFLYTGNLSKDQFKKLFSRRFMCWDLRTQLNGDDMDFTVKTATGFVELQGQVISLRDDRTYTIPKRGSYNLSQKIAKMLRKEAKSFDKKDRFKYDDHNNLNQWRAMNLQTAAYNSSKKFQTKSELTMSFEQWKIYVMVFSSQFNQTYLENNEVGMALVKSGLGYKNIDAYIHNGQMQDVYVNYNKGNSDSLAMAYNTILYKSINTSMSLSPAGNGLTGYYFKNRPNYIIRFTDGGLMQVTKPDKVVQSKKGNMITLEAPEQYNVTGMDSRAITRLILN